MPKIVCNAKDCDLKNRCGRYTEKPTDYQSHLTRKVGAGKCFMFEDIKKK